MKANSKSEWLILIPTELERIQLKELATIDNAKIELCGFGPVMAAARASQLIASVNPKRIMLIGIAGGNAALVEKGAAYQFRSVVCHGVGIGHGEDHVDASDAGWKLLDSATAEVGSEVKLQVAESLASSIREQLRTVCAATANSEEADWIGARYPKCAAEDMEAFGVAVAAELAAVPLHVVRGISNQIGDRDHDGWKIETALQAAASLALDVIRSLK